MKNKLEAVLHPVRMRILQTLMNGERLTAQQMKTKLTDVAVPTLYRHLNAMVEHQVIEIVEENQIRGTVEKVYALPNENIFSKQDLIEATPEDHMDYFLIFMTSLLGQFNSYITSEGADPLKDNVGYRQIQLYLSDKEFNDMFMQIRNIMMHHLNNEPNDDRKLYSISTVIIPNTPETEEVE